MKQKQLFIFFILIGCIAFSCNKKESKIDKSFNSSAPHINKFSPTNPKTDDTLTINGENFSKEPNQVSVYLIETDEFGKSYRIPFKTISSSLTSIVTVIPNELPTFGNRAYTLQIEISPRSQGVSNTVPINILYPEPKGKWFYYKDMELIGSPIGSVYFSSDQIGYLVLWRDFLYGTTDGGTTWQIKNGDNEFNYAFSAFNTSAWLGHAKDVLSTTNGKDWIPNKMDTITSIPYFNDGTINGLYMSSPTKGQLLKSNGRLYYINGSFTPENIIAEYASVYTPSKKVHWEKMSNIDEFNLIIAGQVKYAEGDWRSIIAHKKAGIFNEYEVTDMFPIVGNVKALQLVSKDTAFLLEDYNNNLFKLTSGTNWVKLTQKATAIYFTDANTGYAVYNGKILKTTDGGNSWKDEFVLRQGDDIVSITGKNGKLWAVGKDSNGTGMIMKYNP